MQYLVHFNASFTSTSTLTDRIGAVGGIVSSYIPDHTLLVVAEPKVVETLKKLEGLSLCLVSRTTCITAEYRSASLSMYMQSTEGIYAW